MREEGCFKFNLPESRSSHRTIDRLEKNLKRTKNGLINNSTPLNRLKYNPLNPKSDQFLVSPYCNDAESLKRS